MEEETTNSIDVLIVGAGPTGLTLAHQLSRYAIPYRIIKNNPLCIQKL